jgi:hypothetical protein
MSISSLNCWAFRIDRRHVAALDAELKEQRLRQGWGWDPKQDLRGSLEVDAGASRNRPMFNRVKKGDYLLIPHLPQYGQITIAEGTEDWNKGYQFSVWERTNDHGHIFPARPLRNFRRGNKRIPADLKDTFRNPSRFWNINYLAEHIKAVLDLPEEVLEPKSSVVDQWRQQLNDITGKSQLQKQLIEAAQKHFSKSDWEYLLVDALQELNPSWEIRRTGGKAEAKHGTDILAVIPDIFGGDRFGMAIQVKDYQGFISDVAIKQIQKAKGEYWKSRGIKIVELIVVVIKGDKEAGHEFAASAEKAGVRLIWSTDVEDLVFRSACRIISDPDRQAVTIDSPADDEEADDSEA